MDLDSKLHQMTTLIVTETPQGSARGTGFFYQVTGQPPEPDKPGWQWVPIDVWIITNRHVLLPRVNGAETQPHAITFHLRRGDATGIQSWAPITLSGKDLNDRVRLHPNEHVDVAAVNVSELIAQEIQSNKDQFNYSAPFCLSRSLLPRIHKEIRVEASSDVLVVGYPRGYFDNVNLFPIVKSGIIASKWGANFQGKPCFLIDAKLFPGSSGSVVISKPIDMVMKDGQLFTLKNADKAFVLLGIFSGEPQTQTETVKVGDLSIAQTLEYGVGIVWYAETIEEILA